MGFYTDTAIGKLISRPQGSGTLSAGPAYFLIPSGKYAHWGEILIRKKVHRWENDPELHPLVNHMVEINVDVIETKDTITFEYISIKIALN